MKYEEKLESIKNELEALSRVLSELNDAIDEEHAETLNTPKETPNLSDEKTDMERWQVVHDLQKPLTKYWEGTVLEDKVDDLLLWCKASTVPRICSKVIASQTQIETDFGRTGHGKNLKNLTGIRCYSKNWTDGNGGSCEWWIDENGKLKGNRVYTQYHYSLKDSVKLFVEGDFEDYFTLYGWEEGLSKYLKKFGTDHYWEVKHICEKVLN